MTEEESIEGFRLSPQQKRLWILQHDAQSAPYRTQCAIRIQGELKTNLLQQAIEQVVNRHEILRTRFSQISGVALPLQIVDTPTKIVIRTYNLSEIPPKDQGNEIEKLLSETRQQPLDLNKAHPLELGLVFLTAHHHVLLVTLPALCSDAASLENFVGELSRHLAASGHAEGIATEQLQYADIAQWQIEILESSEAETGKTYWQNKKYPSLGSLKLPFETIRTQFRDFCPTNWSIPIERETFRKIERLVKVHQTSTSAFLLTCWKILLWRITGQSNMIIGNYFHGRSHKELQGLLGLFGKYLPVQSFLANDSPFADVLKQVERSAREGEQWHEYFDWKFITRTDANEKPLGFFPFTFHYKERAAPWVVETLKFSLFKHYTCIDRFHLKLSCVREEDTLFLDLHYDRHVISTGDIQRLAQQFQTVLRSVLRHPNTVVSQIEVVSNDERRQVLIEFNRTKKEIPSYQGIHQRFETQVTCTPDCIAVVYEGSQVTYAELNGRANQLAHYLRRQGVGPDVVVGLCMNRSLEMIIGLLGILKAGGAYLPLDTTLPRERLQYMVQQAQASILLIQEDWLEKLADLSVAFLCLDSAGEVLAKESQENADGQVCSRNLVYILFTSGSTGRPKGVAVEHRQLLHYVDGILDRLALPPESSFATLSPLTTDLGNTMLYPSLCTGGTLYIVSEKRAIEPQALAEYFQQHHPDSLKIVPSHLEALLTDPIRAGVLPRQRLILGGEACHWSLVKKVQTLMPECVVINHYGPTETSVGVTTHRVENTDSDQRDSAVVPIGRPLANSQIYLLDIHLKPVPIGVVGELYVSGHGVARGYATLSTLTAERFLPNPFGNDPGARMYRTGDLARYRPNGTIDFRGRADHQVKLRGYRIELGEIEMVLRDHPAVKEAVVILREDTFHDLQLVAYIVSHQKFSLTDTELPNFLHQRLPDHMVPRSIMFLGAIPLTSNGKIDRQALPSPTLRPAHQPHAIVAPRTPMEEQLIEIWQEVLHVDQISIHDNFLELGGNSLLAIKLIAGIRASFNLEVLFRDLFYQPTIASLAEELVKKGNIQTRNISLQHTLSGPQGREEGLI
jgi:amino acid adenylation domain-containing protein